MRDSERIDRILGEIKKIWTKSPDLRLFQLLTVSLEDNYKDDWRKMNGTNFFNLEDDILEKCLKYLSEECWICDKPAMGSRDFFNMAICTKCYLDPKFNEFPSK